MAFVITNNEDGGHELYVDIDTLEDFFNGYGAEPSAFSGVLNVNEALAEWISKGYDIRNRGEQLYDDPEFTAYRV